MTRSLWSMMLAAALVMTVTSPALAQDAEPAPSPIVLGQGQFEVVGMLELNLSKSAVGKPFSIAPDLYYGVLPALTVGLLHSGYGSTGFLGGVGNGLCVTGSSNGCGKVYNNIGLQADYAFLNGPLAVSAQAGVFFRAFSPELFLAFKVGLMARYLLGPMVIKFNPSIFIGATKRDLGNKEGLLLPLTLAYMINSQFSAGIQTGMQGQLDGFGDTWMLPLSFYADYWINDNMGLMLAFTLGAVAGGDAIPTGADMRSINFGFTYRH